MSATMNNFSKEPKLEVPENLDDKVSLHDSAAEKSGKTSFALSSEAGDSAMGQAAEIAEEIVKKKVEKETFPPIMKRRNTLFQEN